MISLRTLDKSVSQGNGRLFILRQVSVDIAAGEFVSIMGPSGAGKSTLLAVLGMLDGDWTGEYRFLDHAVHKMKPKDRVALNKRHIGFVFQQYHLLDDLTVAENLDVPLSYRNIKKSERDSLLADEPTGNLPSSQGKEIMELFTELNRGGTTIVQVTHSETNAGYGNRVVPLRDGWVVK